MPNESHNSCFDGDDAVPSESSSGSADDNAAHDMNFSGSHRGNAMDNDSHCSSDHDAAQSDDSADSSDDSNDGDGEAVVKYTKYPNGLYSSCFYVEFVPIFTQYCVCFFLSIALLEYLTSW
jgi:hypothetical protein